MVRPTREFGTHGFLELPENRLACQALKRLLPHSKSRKRELVTLFGPTGCGKSELVRTLWKQWQSKQAEAKIRIVTASEFSAQHVEAVDANVLPQFQQKYRKNVDLLVCEDIQALAARPQAQRELTTAIDEVIAHGGSALLTAIRSPGEIEGLIPRLVSRCHGGICVGVQLPGLESRTALMRHFAAASQLPVSATLAERIARRIDGSPRELLGFLQQVNAHLQRSRTSVPLAKLIDQLLSEHQAGVLVEISDVAKATARYFDVTLNEMRGPRRSQPIVLARHMAMYLSRELTCSQLQEIGRYFGDRNHSTVLHALKQIEGRLHDDAVIARHAEEIRSQLQAAGLRVHSG